jgi:hypothetical protein
MDRRQLLFGASPLGLVTNLNLNHPVIAQVGNAVMGSRRLSDRERAGLRGPVKTCSDLIGTGIGTSTDYSTDGRLLGYRVRGAFGGLLGMSDIVDMTIELNDKQSNKTKVCRISIGVTDEFQYDEQGRKTRVRKVSPSSILSGYGAMFVELTFEVAEAGGSLSGGGTVTTRYNESDQPIESLVRNSGGELLMKFNHNYTNGRLISETLVIVNAFEVTRQMRARFSENDSEEARAALDQLQGLRVERSYTYDADDRVIRRLTQAGNSKEDESKTYNAYGDEDWTLKIRSGSDDEREEFRYLYQYDSHGNWTERTTINTDQPGDPNTQRRTLSYY